MVWGDAWGIGPGQIVKKAGVLAELSLGLRPALRLKSQSVSSGGLVVTSLLRHAAHNVL